MNNAMKAAMVLAVLLASVAAVSLATDSADAAAPDLPDIEQPTPADNPAEGVTVANVSSGNPVAEIDGHGYASLQAAVDAVPADGTKTTITLLDDIEQTVTVTIPSGKNIVLDMAEKTISAADDYDRRLIVNNGTLTLTGNGTMDASKDNADLYGPLDNYGTLIIENGTYKGNLVSNASLIWNRTGGTATFNGGDYSGSCIAIATGAGSITTIKGGTYTSPWYPAFENRGEALITGGSFTNTSCSGCDNSHWGYTVRNGVDGSGSAHLVIRPAEGSEVVVTGTQGGVSAVAGNLEIYGGTFKTVKCEKGHDNVYYALYVAPEHGSVEAKVHGGDFSSEVRSAARIGLDNGTSTVPANLSIYDGTFTAPSGTDAVSVNSKGGGDANVSSGAFSSAIDDQYMETGLVTVLDETTKMYEVVIDEGSGYSPVASIGGKEYPSVSSALEAAVNGDVITILKDEVVESITIPAGLEVTINLNGKRITNEGGQHTITNNGTLTIIDGSESHTGTVDNITHGKGAVVNLGTFILESGKLTRSAEAGVDSENDGDNSWYVVDNHGVMTIRGGTVVATGHYSSLIRNVGNGGTDRATLTIAGGDISNGFIAVKNDDYADLVISGGTITSDEQAVQNWSVAHITGGTFNGDVISWSYDGHTTSISIGGSTTHITGNVGAIKYSNSDPSTVDDPDVTITGGRIDGILYTSTGLDQALDQNATYINVSGGTFGNPVEDRFAAEGFVPIINEDGNYGVVSSDDDRMDITVEGDNVVVDSENGYAYVDSADEFNATVTIDFGNVELVIQGLFSKGTTIIQVDRLTGNGVLYDIAYEIETPLADLSSLTVIVQVNIPEGQRLVDANVYRQDSLGGTPLEISNVSVSGDTIRFVTTENSVYQIDAVFESIIVDPPYNPGWDDDDVPVLPPNIVVNQNDGDDETVKIAACAAAAVAAAIIALILVAEYRKK